MVQLQISDILSDDTSNADNGKQFQVTIYGRTITNQTIVCNVIGFKPYFYMKVPKHWTVTSVKRFLNDIEGNIESYIKPNRGYNAINDLIPVTEKHFQYYNELYGFQCDSEGNRLKHRFLKLEFSSYTAMKQYSNAIRQVYSTQTRLSIHCDIIRDWLSLTKDSNCDSYLYETNIHPLVKFIHSRNIQPADWIQVDVDEDELIQDKLFPQSDIVLDMILCDQVHPISIDKVSPFIIASFDIECDSSHGDFPVANKDYKKLGIELYDALLKLYEKNTTDPTLQKKLLIWCIQGAFDDSLQTRLINHNPPLQISRVYTVDNKSPTDEFIESTVDFILQISDLYNLKKRDSHIQKITKRFNTLLDESIQVEGDKVIQIGTVFQRYGEEKPFFRHILVIAPEDNLPDKDICDPLDDNDITVVCCKNEKQLLLEWSSIIQKIDPDYITGYNIFGFDFAYMLDRMQVYCSCTTKWCRKGCCMKQFMNMGKINSYYAYEHYSKKCKEVKKKISHYGSTDYNRYIHMDGRIIYDLQKEVEKGHNLESYKLDNVAAHFMRGKITKIVSFKTKRGCRSIRTTSKLYTKDFGNLKLGDYVSLKLHSNIGETNYSDNQKFKILKLVQGEEQYIVIKDCYFKSTIINCKEKQKSRWTPDASEYFKIEWCLMKDDVSPQDIFNYHKSGGPSGRALVAKYCIQDCELCINLTFALDIIPNNMAMANVCLVPQSYIYLRGQGVKIFSLISKTCDDRGYRIQTVNQPFDRHDLVKHYNKLDGSYKDKRKIIRDILIQEAYESRYSETKKPEEIRKQIETDIQDLKDYKEGHKPKEPWVPYQDYCIENQVDLITTDNPPPRSGYEGAIVLDPEPGIYLDDPVGVVDYASLYPSSIIEKNISHDTLIEDPKYLEYLPQDKYESITYDNYVYEEAEGKITISKKISETHPKITCHFLKKQEGQPMGIIPEVVNTLLKQRKATKFRLKQETNEFKKKVLDGLQLSYKLVANSVYGQTGAKTSPIYKNPLAASTTAIGRQRIYDAKWGVQGDEGTHENGWWNDDDPECGGKMLGVVKPPVVIYGDTDSVFIKWSRYREVDGEIKELKGQEALDYAYECGVAAGKWVTKHKLHKPQDLEYEKTFYPFILVSKKRYVADKYEFDMSPGSCKRNSMGIVLKRRDNAPIVKHVFGNVIEKIMIDKDLQKSIDWLKQTLADIRAGKFPPSFFIITKSLRGYYKNPTAIAHKVLAERIGERDPGNKPKAGDRIPFAYRILPEEMLKDKDNVYKSGPRKGQPKDKKVLQGDRIEDPTYMKQNNIGFDYEFYITNQIMNPVKQVLDLEMNEQDTIELFKPPPK